MNKKPRKKQLCINLPADLLDALDAIAEQQSIPRSTVIQLAVNDFLAAVRQRNGTLIAETRTAYEANPEHAEGKG